MLFDGEELKFVTIDNAPPAGISDREINEKYAKGEVRIVTEQARYPLDTISSKIVDNEKYVLNPEYQRRRRWSNVRKSRLMESLVMNVPIPPIFLYEYDFSKYEVMDGLQRLTAIHEFYTDQFSLEELEQWPELNGRFYSTLPEKIREGIDRRYLSSVILLKETAKDEEEAAKLKQLVFERLNSGGEKLEPQETRNALFNGPLNKLCLSLSLDRHLCLLWGIPPPTEGEAAGDEEPRPERAEHPSFREMEDVELVLRFFAYRQKHQLHKGTSLTNYLDNYLRYGNRFPPSVLNSLADLFLRTTELVYQTFGEKAFWLYRQRAGKWYWRDSVTTTIYDPMMYVLSNHVDRKDEILARREEINNGLEEFYVENYDIFEGRNVNPSILKQREDKLEAFILRFIR